jgi:mannose-6-phosphate isomerase-like protein (cupin superfamily)
MLPLVNTLASGSEFYIDEGCFVTELSSAGQDAHLSIARCRVEPGKRTRWHFLSETVERYVIQSGSGLVEVGNLPPQSVVSGDFVLIPAGCRQRISNVGSVDLIFLAICTPRFQPDCYRDIE